MKKFKFILVIILLAGVILPGCKDKEKITESAPVPVRFTSGIATAVSKAAIDDHGNSIWEQGDPIGIFMVEKGTFDLAAEAGNVKYTAASAGPSTSFTPAGTPVFYPEEDTDKVEFIAYHPYNSTATNYRYPVDVSDQSSQTAIDLMYATANNSGNGYSVMDAATPVDFVFGHQLVKLVLNVTKATGITDDITAVSIHGMNTTAGFDLKGTDGLTDESTPAAILPYKVPGSETYEAILLPVTNLTSGHTVTFTCGEQTFTWKMTDNTSRLDAGSIYIYDIVLTRYAVNITGSTINKWTIGDTGTGIAD